MLFLVLILKNKEIEEFSRLLLDSKLNPPHSQIKGEIDAFSQNNLSSFEHIYWTKKI